MKLHIENLSFSYHKSLKLIHELSFTLTQSQCLHIKGANGCGKTTLLRIIAGLQRYSRGKVFISPKSQEKSAFCELLTTEKNGLFPHLSALDNLFFWTQLNNSKLSSIDLLAHAREWGLENKYSLTQVPLKKFSTGMKRKIALLKAFLSPAPILLLDEPMNGLDQESSKTFIYSLKQAKESGRIVLLSSHHNASLYHQVVDDCLEL